MPYIRPKDRGPLLTQDVAHVGQSANTAGELNFVLTSICLGYLQRNGTNYATMNEILGVLSAVGFEFYRRIVAPYEQEKIEQNGDVYPGEE